MFNGLWDRTFEWILPVIGPLKLDVFHMRNFRYDADLAKDDCFSYCNSLKTLYVVHPDGNVYVQPPEKLKKLVIYCPKSSKDIIEGRKVIRTGLGIDVDKCHTLKEM